MKFLELLVYFFLLAYISDECRTQENQFAGHFRLVFHQVGQCDETGTRQIYATSTRITKVSRTKYVYSTNLTTEIEISDAITGEMDLAVFGNGGWRPHFMQVEFPNGCSSMKTMLPDLFTILVKAVGSDCPVPPGKYEIGSVDLVNIQMGKIVPTFPYGKYRSDVTARVNGTVVGCFRSYFDAVPAKRSKPKKKPNPTS